MSVTRRVALSDFVTLQRGFDLPAARRKVGDVPIVASSGIAGYHNEAKVQAPGVVIGRSGSIGGGQYLAEDFWPLNTTLWVKDFKGNNRRFTYYLLKSIDFSRFNAGAGVPTLNRNHIASLQVPAYDEHAQTRIASMLSAYDDLIKNNRRRIQLLEQAARLLYEEWFVHLRFPGHEHVTVTDGVPEGWERKPFSELASFLNGFAFKPSHLGEVGLPIVKIPELRAGPSAKTPRNTGERIPEKYLLGNGDILFSWSGTLLVNIWNHGRGLLNQHLFKVTPASMNLRGLVYFALRQALAEFRNQTTGATMKHIRKGALEKVTSLVPPSVLLGEFEGVLSPVLAQISVLQRQTTEATKARDLLLPRLMNGEIEV